MLRFPYTEAGRFCVTAFDFGGDAERGRRAALVPDFRIFLIGFRLSLRVCVENTL